MSEEMDDPYDDKPPQKARKKAAEQAAESPDPGVAQETQSLLPKVALDGSKAKAQGMSESLPQLAPKPGMQQAQQMAGQRMPQMGGQRPQAPNPMMMQQQRMMQQQAMQQQMMMQRMAQQGQMMPRMPQQAPGGQQRQQMPILMPQITPQMRAQQQQQAMMMRARGPQQMFPGMNPAMVQAARQMQMQRMAMQRFRHPAPPQGGGDDEDGEDDDDEDDDDEDDEDSEDEDEEDEEDEEEEEEEEQQQMEEAEVTAETKPEEKEKEAPKPEPPKESKRAKTAKRKEKEKEQKEEPKVAEGEATTKKKKGRKKKKRLAARHDITPIIGRGRLRLDGVGPGEGEILPRAFGTPRDALPDIAGIKKVARAYDPAEFENLSVTAEIKELFQYITRYTPQSIELDHKLKPFIPDFIPSVGDIDAFIKIPRPDQKPDTLGLTVLDEPCAKQSDPTVLDLQLRAISKQTTAKTLVVKSLENAEKNPRAIENWIESIRELHRSKPPPNVHYSRNMPDIDTLMQEWPPEFEELLKEVSLPTADLDCDLGQFTEIICSVLDIPVYKNSSHHNEKIQALHVLFTLYSEFKNSQHFQSLAANNQLDNTLKDGSGGPGDSLLL
nr:hypothetical protein BaRGS_007244 [Batillaria attramentaria]